MNNTQQITDAVKIELIDSLSNALVTLAEGGILNYAEEVLGVDRAECEEDGDRGWLVDLQVGLPLVFEPVKGFKPVHAQVSGFVSYTHCKMIGDEDEGDWRFQWEGQQENMIMNFGYHGCNLVWSGTKNLTDNHNYKVNDYAGWQESEEVGITQENDEEMGLAVAEKAIEKMSVECRDKFFHELMQIANRRNSILC